MNVEQIVDKLLREARLPDFVDSWVLIEDTDSTGDPTVYIWLIVDDAAAASSDFPLHTRELRERIFRIVSAAIPQRWPYVSFRSRSDQDLLAEEAVV
jgi:hypothetical protein